jgi:hypothetical protein
MPAQGGVAVRLEPGGHCEGGARYQNATLQVVVSEPGYNYAEFN